MKKKKSGGGGANWMDTYGDMVTLLLCFFVLLYSMSTIDTEKFKAMVMSFNPNAVQTPTEVEDGNKGPVADPVEDAQAEIDSMIEQLYEALQQYSREEGMESTLQVSMDGGKVYVRFNETAFFNGNDYRLRSDAKEVLTSVCSILDQVQDAIDEIRIQGHTAQPQSEPNEPYGDRFLASNRATTVLLFIQEHSAIHPAQLVSEGYGQWRPIGDNKTSEGLAINRRVEMIITGRNLEQEALGNTIQHYITQDQADQTQADQAE